MTYDQYIAEWDGHQVKKYGGECVAGVAEFEAENNLPIVWGNAHTWINNPIMLRVYEWTANDPADPNQLPNRGDIVVWPLPNEHIAFYDHNLGNHQFMSFGQNSGGLTMHFQPHTWTNVAGWYTPLGKTPTPPPEAPPPIVHPYTIENITAKQVKLNKDTHLWGLNYDNGAAIQANPQADAIAGTLLTVRAILHHFIGQNYYLSDPDVPSGYNVVDCDDYTPPPPAGPVSIPNSETYELIKEVPGYITSNQAVNRLKPQVNVPAGSYFVFNRRFSADGPTLLAVNVTKTNGSAGAWINVEDNVETPPEPPTPPEPQLPAVPEPPAFAATYKELPQPELYVAMINVPVIDLAGTKTVTMPQYSVTKISGSFVVNGIEYARPESAVEKNLWYGIELVDRETGLANIELEADVYSAKTSIADRAATHTLRTIDKLALVVAHLRNAYLSFAGFLGRIKAERKNKKGSV